MTDLLVFNRIVIKQKYDWNGIDGFITKFIFSKKNYLKI